MEGQNREYDQSTPAMNEYTSEDMRGSSGVFSKKSKLENMISEEQKLRHNKIYNSYHEQMRESIESTTSTRGSFNSSRGSVGNFRNQINSSHFNSSKNREDDLNLENLRENINLRRSIGVFNTNKFKESITKIDEPTKIKNINQNTSQNLIKNSPFLISLITEKYKYLGEVNKERKREGFGVCYYINGDKYSGKWVNDKKEGYGKYFIKISGKNFQGEFKNNIIDGFVEYINKNGVSHLGIMRNLKFINGEAMLITHPKFELSGLMEYNTHINKLTGLAKIRYKNGIIYEGETQETYENGWGITKNPDGTFLKAFKEESKFNNYCEIEHQNGEKYFGWFTKNKKNGIGISINKDGVYTIGKFNDDMKDGAFLECFKGEAKFELFLFGFLTKTIEKKENIINYVNLVYPEYKWIISTNNKLLAEILIKV